MEGRELREAILHEQSRGGTPYEVVAYYDGRLDVLQGRMPPICRGPLAASRVLHALRLSLRYVEVRCEDL
jgi:hypothetical protein